MNVKFNHETDAIQCMSEYYMLYVISGTYLKIRMKIFHELLKRCVHIILFMFKSA